MTKAMGNLNGQIWCLYFFVSQWDNVVNYIQDCVAQIFTLIKHFNPLIHSQYLLLLSNLSDSQQYLVSLSKLSDSQPIFSFTVQTIRFTENI